MIQLSTKQVYVPQPTPQMPPPPPALSFTFPKPVSYEFRVAEHIDAEGKITKVGLQVQVWEHDEYGVGIIKQTWTDVQRVKLKDGILQP